MTPVRSVHDRIASAAPLQRGAEPCAYGRPVDGSAGAPWKESLSLGMRATPRNRGVGFDGGTSEDGTVRGP